MYAAVKKLLTPSSSMQKVLGALNSNRTAIQDFAEFQDKDHSWTPDVHVIEKQPFHLIFFYDDMMPGYPEYQAFMQQCSSPQHTAFTLPTYALHQKEVGRSSKVFAVLPTSQERTPPWMDPRGAPPAKIKGRLVVVTKEAIYDLDEHYENGVQFDRIRTSALVPYRQVLHLESGGIMLGGTRYWNVKTWMYLGVDKFWYPQLDNGYLTKPVKILRPRDVCLGDYYFHRRRK